MGNRFLGERMQAWVLLAGPLTPHGEWCFWPRLLLIAAHWLPPWPFPRLRSGFIGRSTRSLVAEHCGGGPCLGAQGTFNLATASAPTGADAKARSCEEGALRTLSPSRLPMRCCLLPWGRHCARQACCNPGAAACFVVVLGQQKAAREEARLLRFHPSTRVTRPPPRPIIPTCRGWIGAQPEQAAKTSRVTAAVGAAGDRTRRQSCGISQRHLMAHVKPLGFPAAAGIHLPVALESPIRGKKRPGDHASGPSRLKPVEVNPEFRNISPE